MINVDPDGVRRVGNELYPAVADIYKDVHEKVDKAARTWIPNHERFESALHSYVGLISRYLSVSDSRLRDCGDALVEMADDLQDVDEDNAKSVASPVEGLPKDDGKMKESEGG